MTLIADDIVINPEEAPVVPARPEKSLSQMGLSVVHVDWGDSTASEDDKRTITAELVVREDTEADLPTAAYELQQVVGEMQERETWLRRDPKVGGSFAGPVMYRVKVSQEGAPPEVTLSGLGGWQAGDSPNVVLTIIAEMTAYSAVEEEVGSLAEATANHFIYTLPASKGSAKGLRRVRVKNANASGAWRGLIFAEECWDYSSAATALLAYEAQKLTPRGGSSVVTKEGRKVVESAALTQGWATILSDEIVGTGHMTHRGPRRMKVRVWDPGTVAGNVELRLLWRPLGQAEWTEEEPVKTTLVGNQSILDLGLPRPQVAALGGERWEWAIQATAREGTPKIRLLDIYPLPGEQFLEVSDTTEAQVDGELSKPATVRTDAGAESGKTVAWGSSGEPRAASFTGAAISHWLLNEGFGFAIPTGATLLGVVASIRWAVSGAGFWETVMQLLVEGKRVGAFSSLIFGFTGATQTLSLSQAELEALGLTVAKANEGSFGVGVYATQTRPASAIIEAFAPTITVAYSEGANENRVCFAGRSMEIRSDGVHRQHVSEEVWGRLGEDGFLPRSVPAGFAGRTMRGIVIPTQGDLAARPDVGTNKAGLSIFDRPGYHIARESA